MGCQSEGYYKQPPMSRTTPNAITLLLAQPHGEGQSLIVEASCLRRVKEEHYMKAQLSDGNTTIKAIFNTSRCQVDLMQQGTPFGEKPTYLIAITHHVTHNFQGGKILEILNFIPLKPPSQQPEHPQTRHSEQPQPIPLPVKQQPEPLRKEPSILRSEQRPLQLQINQGELKEYWRIGQLQPQAQGWRIVARVLSVSYKEFKSKSGKLTKICTLRLVDSSGVKIQAVMFGEEARELQRSVREDEVLRVSRAQVKENQYAGQQRDDYTSRFTIVLTRNSEVTHVTDIPCIPRAEEGLLSLPDILAEMNFGTQFDVLAVLLEVGEQQSYEKEGRAVFKRSLVVGDPKARKSMEAIVWGGTIDPPRSLIGHTVLLKDFRLNQYRESLSLSSTFKSQILPREATRFQTIQHPLSLTYQCVSSSIREHTREVPLPPSSQRWIRDLQSEVQDLRIGDNIICQLQFWVSFINFRSKWYYDACNNPRCKKQADSYARCLHCGTLNEALPKKFILAIEITDFTGSLWITAFDDFAGDLLAGVTADALAELNEGQLKSEGEKRLFQQFRGKVTTKRGEDGAVRHTFIGKPSLLSIQKAMLSNLERIDKAIF